MEIGFTKFDTGLMIEYATEESKELDKDYWRVLKPFKYYLGTKGSNRWVIIPAGYLTDGASVPQPAWGLIPPWGSYGQACVLHDYLCEYLSITEDGLPKSITRKECDDILAEAMKVLDVSSAQQRIINSGVNVYRIISGKNTPTNDVKKRALESKWVQKAL